jgi:hypothetical protein
MKLVVHRFSMKSLALIAGLAGFFALSGIVQGCRVQAGNPQSAKPVKPGTVTIALADAPVDELSQIFVKVEGIAFAPAGTGHCLREPKRGCANSALYAYQLNKESEVDLLALSDGRTQVLPFSQDLSSGTYEGVRLFLAEDSKVEGVLKSNGSRIEIEFPQSPFGRKEFTIIEEFEVQEGTDNEIIIHVDLRRSLRRKPDGNFILFPMTNVVPTRIAGRIFGTVASADVTRVCAYNLAGKRRQAELPKPQDRVLPPAQPPHDQTTPFPRAPYPQRPLLSAGPRQIQPQMDATSSCDNADAVSDPKNGLFDLRYLMPVPYTLRSFKEDGSYSDRNVTEPLRPREERELVLQ